jgi:hypothetical protein
VAEAEEEYSTANGREWTLIFNELQDTRVDSLDKERSPHNSLILSILSAFIRGFQDDEGHAMAQLNISAVHPRPDPQCGRRSTTEVSRWHLIEPQQ